MRVQMFCMKANIGRGGVQGGVGVSSGDISAERRGHIYLTANSARVQDGGRQGPMPSEAVTEQMRFGGTASDRPAATVGHREDELLTKQDRPLSAE